MFISYARAYLWIDVLIDLALYIMGTYVYVMWQQGKY